MDAGIAIWRMRGSSEKDISLEKILFDPMPVSLDEVTRLLPDGAYTTFRTFSRFQVLSLGDHLNRLEETARLSGRPISLSRTAVKAALRQAFSEYPIEVKRVRIILDLYTDPGAITILIEALAVPTEVDYECGVKVITRTMQRQNPRAKLTGFIDTATSVRQEIPPGIHEVVMIGEDQQTLEGLSSNFFAVKDGVIWTASQDVLAGITRQTVLEIIQAQELPIVLLGIRADMLGRLDEAFLTSTSRDILPIQEIDGQCVDDSTPGKITRRLMKAYRDAINGKMETL